MSLTNTGGDDSEISIAACEITIANVFICLFWFVDSCEIDGTCSLAQLSQGNFNLDLKPDRVVKSYLSLRTP